MIDPQETDAGRIAVADEMRALLHNIVGRDHSVEALESIADQLAAVNETAQQAEVRQKSTARFDYPDRVFVPADGEAFHNSIDRPISGPGNPFAIPLHVERHGDKAVTTVMLGPGYEGAPTRSHGGIVAAIYDDLLGFLTMLQQGMAFTAYLTVNYRAATPINEELTFSAWVSHREGRKLFMAGECQDATGATVTTCEALFIEPRQAGH